jgi:hypothetical protein
MRMGRARIRVVLIEDGDDGEGRTGGTGWLRRRKGWGVGGVGIRTLPWNADEVKETIHAAGEE